MCLKSSPIWVPLLLPPPPPLYLFIFELFFQEGGSLGCKDAIGTFWLFPLSPLRLPKTRAVVWAFYLQMLRGERAWLCGLLAERASRARPCLSLWDLLSCSPESARTIGGNGPSRETRLVVSAGFGADCGEFPAPPRIGTDPCQVHFPNPKNKVIQARNCSARVKEGG